MHSRYKGYDIQCFREKNDQNPEDSQLFYSIFKDGFCVTEGYDCGMDTVRDYVKYLKCCVDKYIGSGEIVV